MSVVVADPIPAPHLHTICAGHNHGLDDTIGYVVTLTKLTDDVCTFEDVVYFPSATRYGEALDLVRLARAAIASGHIDATYAVIHTVYEGGCRPV